MDVAMPCCCIKPATASLLSCRCDANRGLSVRSQDPQNSLAASPELRCTDKHSHGIWSQFSDSLCKHQKYLLVGLVAPPFTVSHGSLGGKRPVTASATTQRILLEQCCRALCGQMSAATPSSSPLRKQRCKELKQSYLSLMRTPIV